MAKRIEIRTAHNIIVYFELASLADRIIATLIDLMVISALGFAFGLVGSFIGADTITYVSVFLIAALYHLLFEIYNGGQSLGKMAMKTKVVNLKGIPPNPSEALQRWVFRMLDITFSVGALGAIFIVSSPKNQRLGDLIGSCTVIKLGQGHEVSLDRVERIQDREREILYPGVTNYSDEDMILVKDILSRHGRFKNRSTRKAMDTITKKIAGDLKVKNIEPDQKAFLENVLKDYVTLTR